MLGIAKIAAAELEQAHRRCAAVEIAARCSDQTGQERGPHYLHVLADGIGKPPVGPAEGPRFVFGNEAPGNRLVEPARSRGPPYLALEELGAGSGRLGDTRRAIERGRWDLVVADDPRHFLDEVGGPFDVTPPRWDCNRIALELE